MASSTGFWRFILESMVRCARSLSSIYSTSCLPDIVSYIFSSKSTLTPFFFLSFIWPAIFQRGEKKKKENENENEKKKRTARTGRMSKKKSKKKVNFSFEISCGLCILSHMYQQKRKEHVWGKKPQFFFVLNPIH